MKFFKIIIGLSILLLSYGVRAELVIPIVSGVDNPTKIAVVPFSSTSANALPENIADVVSANLKRSGQFDA